MDAATSARVDVERSRAWGQELSGGEKKLRGDMARGAEVEELDARNQFKVFERFKKGDISKAVVRSRLAVLLKIAGGRSCVKARLAAKGCRRPDLKDGPDLKDVSLPSPHLQVISPGAIKKWGIWRLDIKNALRQADGLDWDTCFRALPEWDSSDARRTRKLHAPAYGLSDAPAAFRRSSRKYFLNSED